MFPTPTRLEKILSSPTTNNIYVVGVKNYTTGDIPDYIIKAREDYALIAKVPPESIRIIWIDKCCDLRLPPASYLEAASKYKDLFIITVGGVGNDREAADYSRRISVDFNWHPVPHEMASFRSSIPTNEPLRLYTDPVFEIKLNDTPEFSSWKDSIYGIHYYQDNEFPIVLTIPGANYFNLPIMLGDVSSESSWLTFQYLLTLGMLLTRDVGKKSIQDYIGNFFRDIRSKELERFFKTMIGFTNKKVDMFKVKRLQEEALRLIVDLSKLELWARTQLGGGETEHTYAALTENWKRVLDKYPGTRINNGRIIVRTPELDIGGIPIGKFDCSITTSNSDVLRIEFDRLGPAPTNCPDDIHPHINGTSPCLGNWLRPFSTALLQRDFLSIADLFISYLKSYDINTCYPDQTLANWNDKVRHHSEQGKLMTPGDLPRLVINGIVMKGKLLKVNKTPSLDLTQMEVSLSTAVADMTREAEALPT